MANAHSGISPLAPIWLSYPLSPETPAYGGAEGLEVSPLSSICEGDTANTLRLAFPNHLGTHVDVPSHFFPEGHDLTFYQPSDWVFLRPFLVDVHTPSGELVGPEHLAQAPPEDTDLLLIRTGHGLTRGSEVYWQGGPGLSPELGFWIRERHPTIRAVGMDLISVTSRLQRAAGREAHRAFLDPAGCGSPVRLIEDMALHACPGLLDWVLVAPLLVTGADGGPVTVWGFGRPHG